jgi:acylphosphatase
MSKVAHRVRVTGRVQGVAFRWETRMRAQELGIGGWVRNLPDGSVEAWIEGSPPAVARMLDWLRHGPPAARVSATTEAEAVPRELVDFEIR